MTDYLIAATKSTYDVNTETDPNNFIFSSDHNTFKIIKNDLITCNVIGSTDNQVFTRAHNLPFTPLVNGFYKDGSSSLIIPINGVEVTMVPEKDLLLTTGIEFVSIKSDATNIYFTFNNSDTSTHIIKVRFYCLETI
jgi:hypothetical protein